MSFYLGQFSALIWKNKIDFAVDSSTQGAVTEAVQPIFLKSLVQPASRQWG